MRKRIIALVQQEATSPVQEWLNVEAFASLAQLRLA